MGKNEQAHMVQYYAERPPQYTIKVPLNGKKGN
jgi:hypothetical protein